MKTTFGHCYCYCLIFFAFHWVPQNLQGSSASGGLFVDAEMEGDALVEVYDGVLDATTATWLHQECLRWVNPRVVSIFPLANPKLHTPIEQILDQILHQLYPDTTTTTEPRYYVEFWKRTEWQHILAHADMDEGWQRQTSDSPSTPLKHPEKGHVLYLDIASSVRGPTVVWNVTKGGEMVPESEGESMAFEMISVPAVKGRLLRFKGDALHAVPRPTDVYWTHVQDDREGPDFQRSVLLFNTWPIERRIVDFDILNATESEEDAFEGNPILHSCRPKSEWKPVPVRTFEAAPVLSFWERLTQNPFAEFWIPLMGDTRRRGTYNHIAKLEAHKSLHSRLEEESEVTRVVVTPPKTRILGIEL